MRAVILTESGIKEEEREIRRELGSERADAFILISSIGAQCGMTEPSACAEAGRLPTIFLNPLHPYCQRLEQRVLLPCWWRMRIWGKHWPYGLDHHKTCTGCCQNDAVFPVV